MNKNPPNIIWYCTDQQRFDTINGLGNQHINVGVGEDISIRELAELIKEIVGYDGEIVQDLTKPDGTPRKLLNVDRLKSAGWSAKTSLKDGVNAAYRWYQEQS